MCNKLNPKLGLKFSKCLMNSTKCQNHGSKGKDHALFTVTLRDYYTPPRYEVAVFEHFYSTKRFVFEFQGESPELFLSYLAHFSRYHHFWGFWQSTVSVYCQLIPIIFSTSLNQGWLHWTVSNWLPFYLSLDFFRDSLFQKWNSFEWRVSNKFRNNWSHHNFHYGKRLPQPCPQ